MLRAEMHFIVVMSAFPQDIIAVNAHNLVEIHFVVKTGQFANQRDPQDYRTSRTRGEECALPTLNQIELPKLSSPQRTWLF